MNNIKTKRILAYFIDMFIVLLLIYLISQIKVINPYLDKYKVTYEKYNTFIEENYMDNTTTSINKIMNKEYILLLHDLQYYSLVPSITEFLIIVIYFSLFPYFFDGQTIGKKIMKIKIVSIDEKKCTLMQYMLRSLIYPIWTNIIFYTALSNILLVMNVLIFNGKIFYYLNLGISIFFTIYAYADIIKYINNSDGVSFHDKISKTKIVLLESGR